MTDQVTNSFSGLAVLLKTFLLLLSIKKTLYFVSSTEIISKFLEPAFTFSKMILLVISTNVLLHDTDFTLVLYHIFRLLSIVNIPRTQHEHFIATFLNGVPRRSDKVFFNPQIQK